MRRRDFVRRLGVAGGGALLGAPSLQALVARAAAGAAADAEGLDFSHLRAGPGEGGYGPLQEAGPELALPRGFRYVKFGVEGSPMSDGVPTPRAHDGMAAFPRPDGEILLIRNHEDASRPSVARRFGPESTAYDPLGGGGTTSLVVAIGPDGALELKRDFVSLNGTIINCAGGPTPWGSWLSCEETTQGLERGWTRAHGYVFEVPVDAEGPVPAVPLKPLGRFVHEAVAVDPRTGIVYETEDQNTSGFYRFIPDAPRRLTEGGRLQMLAIEGRPRFNTTSGQEVGRPLPVRWVPIPDPDPESAGDDPAAVFTQGYEAGGALFSGLEGSWFADDSVYFHATDGGNEKLGQVWQYRPPREGARRGTLTLVFESPSADVLDSPDNITVSPRGGVVICEDCQGARVRGLTPDGRIFDLARNILNDREFAGACFSPDGRVLFVNVQGDLRPGGPGNLGMTFAIRGPWETGAI